MYIRGQSDQLCYEDNTKRGTGCDINNGPPIIDKKCS